MSHDTLKAKSFTWHHFNNPGEADFRFLAKEFKFHPLDFDDLRENVELPKVDVYKDYIFAVINVPHLNVSTNRVEKRDLAVFIGKKFVVTLSREGLDSVERYFARAKRSNGLQESVMSQSSGFFVYKLLDYVFRDVRVVVRELVKETEDLESLVYSRRLDSTKKLGVLRSKILYTSHILDPQRILMSHFINARKTFIPKDLDIYFDDIKDALDGMWTVTNNLHYMIDGLFSVNEAFLTHRTNNIIRVLTIISVVLMPPTLITSYYGMNVQDLPFANDIVSVSVIVLGSLLVSFLILAYLDKRK